MAAELLRIVPLLSMGKVDSREFSQRVHDNQGQVPLLVHPYHQNSSFSPDDKAAQSIYQTQRDHSTSDLIRKHRPLVVFEARHSIQQLPHKIAHEPGEEGPVYVVRTKEEDAEPLGYNGWNSVAKVLHEAEVDLVELGGEYLSSKDINNSVSHRRVALHREWTTEQLAMERLREYTKTIADRRGRSHTQAYHWIDRDLLPDGCVGETAIELLAQGFDVTFSLATYPDSMPN